MVLAAIPLQSASAQTPYTEKLNVYIAGPNALWYFTFGGVNGSSSLSAFEATPGLSWYNITAIDTTAWKSDFQVFGPSGYDLLPVPFIPSQGLFLSLGSDSYADASAAASALGSYLFTTFTSLSNGTGTYSFFSPLSFESVIPNTLFKLVPTSANGFAGALNSLAFEATASPFIVFEGTSSSSGFDHSLVAGSISASALTSGNSPNILEYFGRAIHSLNASKTSSSSVVKITALDGVLKTTDNATVKNDGQKFTGTYTLDMSQGEKLRSINASVSQGSAPLLATRTVDVGVLRTNGDLAVTLSFTNVSPTETITNLTFADSWWNGTGLFTLLGGNDTVSNTVLAPGSSVTPVYRLEFTGTSAGSVTIPASVVRYQYRVGSMEFNATALLNPITLSLNANEAVVYAILTPLGGPDQAVGTSQSFNLTVVNVGTLPASSVVAAGHSIAGLAGASGSLPGGSATISLTQTATGLTGTNTTRAYTVTYQDPSGNALSATSNVVSDVFSHSSMNIGFPVLTLSSTVTPFAGGTNDLTLGFAVSDLAQRDVHSFTATGTLPGGLGCGTTIGSGITCSGGRVTIAYPVINVSTTVRDYINYNLTAPANFIIAPFNYTVNNAGVTTAGWSNAVAAPAGIVLSKQFSPSQLFLGMASQVTASATNKGSQNIYNVTLVSTADSFDSLASASTLTRNIGTLAQGGNLSVSYTVNMSTASTGLKAYAVTATFIFGGMPFSVSGGASAVSVFKPLSVSITTSPSTPEEGKSFVVSFVVKNPSTVSVSNVQFALPLPSGVSLSSLVNAQTTSKLLTVDAASLAPGANITATATAVASSGILIPFEKATLTFSYAGSTVKGITPTASGIVVSENVVTRYLIPIAFVLVVMLAVAFYLRRAAIVPSSQK